MNKNTLYRLSPDTVVEPLIDRWVAWPHVFSPVPHALHMTHYQRKTLSSYLQNPGIHVKSCRNPKLLGGPFVDIPPERLSEVDEYARNFEQEHRESSELAKTFIDFQNRLAGEAKGQGLEQYYREIPKPLAGYVELVYDYHNNPIVRCLESLLYESPYYKDRLQSLRLFSLPRDEARPYYMSTPRLPDADQIDWTIPFHSERIDPFFKLDSAPQPLDFIREVLELTPRDDGRLLPLLIPGEAPAVEPWQGPEIRIRYFGHACVLLEWNDVSILIDPFIPVLPKEGGIDRFSFRDLPLHIDFVLITHGHHDHFVFESLLRLRHKIGCMVVPRSSGVFYGDISLKLMAQKLGFKCVREVDSLDSIAFPGGEIVAAPFFGEHSDLPHAKSAYVIRAGQQNILFAADSNCLDKNTYEHVRRILGPMRTVFLGMECIGAPLSWVYGPLLPVQPEHTHNMSRRSNGSNSSAAIDLLTSAGAERVYIYAIGREPWLKYFLALSPEENDPYIVESDKVLEYARSKAFEEARRPFGKLEIHLDA